MYFLGTLNNEKYMIVLKLSGITFPSRPALGPTQPPIQGIWGALSWG